MSKEREIHVHKERQNLTIQGPLYVPEGSKDPNFHFAWIKDDPKTPFKMDMHLKEGYEPVKRSEIPELCEDLRGKFGLSSNAKNSGELILQTGKDNITQYLMKIPKEKFAEKEKYREDVIRDRERGMKAKLRNAGGDPTSDWETPNFNNNHIFKI